MARQKQTRGALTAATSERVTITIPKSWRPLLKDAVRRDDSDTSKLTRAALRHHFERRFNLQLPAA